MKITFKKVEIHNFLSYADEVFEFDKHKGMNLICGKNHDVVGSKNGSGKSSSVLSLIYGLFGQLPYKLKNENICNRYVTDKNMSVSVYFDVGNKHYHVISGLQRGKQSYCNLYIIEGGKEKDITKSTIAETRNYIEKEILKCDLNLFMRTIVLNSDPTYNFYNLKAADKKEFIDKLFDISVFGDMYDLIHRDKNQMDKTIGLKQNSLLMLNKNDEEYNEKSNSFGDEKKAKIENLTKAYEITKKELDDKISNTTKRNEEVLNKCEVVINKLTTDINKVNDDIRNIDFKMNESKMSVKRYDSMIADRNKILNTHKDLHSKLCDDCKTIFSDHYNLSKYKKEIDALEEKKNHENELQKSYTEKKTELNTKKKDLTEKFNTINEKVNENNRKYEQEQRVIKELQRKVDNLKFGIDNEKSTINPYIQMIEDNKMKIDEINSELSALIDRYNYLKVSEIVVDQNNLKQFIIKDMIQLLNNKIKHYLHRLGANYDIVFDSDMNYDFITQNRTGAEFHNFSSGEQARISISTCFAFRDFLANRSNITSNILVLDEFIDSNIDSLAIENILEILGEFAKINKQNVYVVSHRSEVNEEFFNQIIQIEKKDNISTINYLEKTV